VVVFFNKTCNFLANFSEHPKICADRDLKWKNPGTFGKIRPKLACQFFFFSFLVPLSSEIFPSDRPSQIFHPSGRFLSVNQTQRGGYAQGGSASTDPNPGAPTGIFLTFFGRTDLRISPSRAKNCEEVDGEVRLPVQPPKLALKGETNASRPKNFVENLFFLAEN